MSTKDLKKKAIFFSFLLIFFSLLTSSIRQLFVFYHTNNNIEQKEKELQALKQKNKALKVRLEEVQSLKFLDTQSREVLGIGDATGTARLVKPTEDLVYSGKDFKSTSNIEKWLNLFFY